MAKKRAEGAAKEPKSGSNKSRGKRVLTDEAVMDIAKNYVPRKVTMRDFAQKYAVSISTIQAILTGRTYAWLTGIGAAPELQQAA